jgi:hypothetical protein
MTPKDALEALDAAVSSWNSGKGEWATSDMKASMVYSLSPHMSHVEVDSNESKQNRLESLL